VEPDCGQCVVVVGLCLWIIQGDVMSGPQCLNRCLQQSSGNYFADQARKNTKSNHSRRIRTLEKRLYLGVIARHEIWSEFLQSFWHHSLTITCITYKISFTGGEVTANKSFLPLIEYLRSGLFDIGQLVVTTNGSASVNYYRRLSELVDSISFSTHSEFFDEAEFFNKVHEINKIMPKPGKSVHVNIMDEWWNQERIELYK
jgi:hypothetical protein